MKQSKLLIIPIALTSILIVLMFIKDDTPFLLITQPSVISSVQTSEKETISIPILTTTPNAYLFSSSYITNAKITSNGQFLPLRIVNIDVLDYQQSINQSSYTLVVFECQPSMSIDQEIIQYESANLQLTYDNNAQLTFPIGEFNFVFEQADQSVLTLGHLMATSQAINGLETIGGVYLELGNQADETLIVHSIEIVSQAIAFNQLAARLVDLSINDTDTVESVLGVASYDFYQRLPDGSVSFNIPKQSSQSVYLPLIYLENITHIGRFAIQVEYEIGGKKQTTFLDDFPFRRYNIFDDALKDKWVIIDDYQQD
jgi:hypothetical protein